jgi:hypothetical protein
VRLLTFALWELKLLEKDFAVLGIDPRFVVDRGRRKQLAALHEAFNALGVEWQADRNYAAATLKAVVEFVFPTDENRGRPWQTFDSAWHAFWDRDPLHDAGEFSVHEHAIKTARGVA